jgi:muconolactone delta-isomerase
VQGHLLRLWHPPLPDEWRTLGLFAADDGQLEMILASMPLRV